MPPQELLARKSDVENTCRNSTLSLKIESSLEKNTGIANRKMQELSGVVEATNKIQEVIQQLCNKIEQSCFFHANLVVLIFKNILVDRNVLNVYDYPIP
uniref:Uncharacterized protein n=1 Tax=Strigamia maritima TaxID=126957 RepID=T1JKC4_STRMM